RFQSTLRAKLASVFFLSFMIRRYAVTARGAASLKPLAALSSIVASFRRSPRISLPVVFSRRANPEKCRFAGSESGLVAMFTDSESFAAPALAPIEKGEKFRDFRRRHVGDLFREPVRRFRCLRGKAARIDDDAGMRNPRE